MNSDPHRNGCVYNLRASARVRAWFGTDAPRALWWPLGRGKPPDAERRWGAYLHWTVQGVGPRWAPRACDAMVARPVGTATGVPNTARARVRNDRRRVFTLFFLSEESDTHPRWMCSRP